MRVCFPRFLPAACGVTIVLLGISACGRGVVKTPSVPAAPPVAEVEESTAPNPDPSPPASLAAEDLAPVFYAYDSYALSGAARAALDRNARSLREQPQARVTIEGHCDERGTAEYNQALGERRAQTARDYLVSAGVPATQIQVVSYGKERPFEEGHNEEAWAKNRRAHFVLP